MFYRPFISPCEIENQELFDYILDNSINIDEYFDGEKEKLIFNSDFNTLEKGFIFESDNIKLQRKS